MRHRYPTSPVRQIAAMQPGPFRVLHKAYSGAFRQPKHAHEMASVDFVLCGGGSGTCSGTRIDSIPGAIEYFPAGADHTFASGPAGIRTLHVVFPSHLLTEAGMHAEARCQILPTERFMRACLEVLSALTGHGTDALSAESACHEIVATLADHGASRRFTHHARAAASMLHDDPCGNLTLASIAAELGIHPGHLARAFREAHGRSVGQYQLGLRLRRAASLLADPDEPSIARVAQSCGFSDQAHLTNHFRRAFGRTPARYRAALRGP